MNSGVPGDLYIHPPDSAQVVRSFVTLKEVLMQHEAAQTTGAPSRPPRPNRSIPNASR